MTTAPDPVSTLGGYELRHLVAHLAAAGRADDLHRLLRIESEDRAEPPGIQNVWYAAHAREGDLSTYVADVRLAWRLAEAESRRETQRGDPGASVGLEVRYALLVASARSRVHGVPPSLMLALVEQRIWSPMQALARARELPRAAERAEALRLLASVPALERDDVLKEALAAVREITGEATYAGELAPIPRDRVAALAALAPELTEPLPVEALVLARSEERPEEQAKALAALAPHLPAALIPGVLAVVRGIEEPFLHAAPLAALVPRLEGRERSEVVDEMLEAAIRLPFVDERGLERAHGSELTELERAALVRERGDPGWRAPPHALKEGQEKALEKVRTQREVHLRASDLAELAPHLDGPGLKRALELALEIEPDWDRSTALVGLIPSLPEPLRFEALESARAMTRAEPRARTLAALARHLREPPRSELVEEVLALVREIDPAGQIHGRVDVLGALVPFLSGSQLSRALSAAEGAGDESARASTLATVARHLPEPAKSETAAHALAVARESGDVTLESTLALLGWPLREDVLGEAVAAARRIEDPATRASALATLLPHVPDADRKGLVEDALTAARSSGPYGLTFGLARAFPHLPDSVMREALDSVDSLSSVRERPLALTALAPNLPDDLVPRAFELARSIDMSNRGPEVIAALAPRLTDAQRSALLSDTLAGEWHFDEEVAALAPYLPSELLSTAFEASRGVEDPDRRGAVLAGLVPSLAGREQEEAIGEALAIVWQAARSGSSRVRSAARTLAELAPHLDERDRGETLAALLEELRPRPELPDWSGNTELRAEALVTLGPLLQPADVGDALRSVCAIDEVTRGPSLRMNLLERLAEPLAALPPTTLGPLLSGALADLWALTRGQFLSELSALVPAIASFGGAAALVEAARAVRDVGRWLP